MDGSNNFKFHYTVEGFRAFRKSAIPAQCTTKVFVDYAGLNEVRLMITNNTFDTCAKLNAEQNIS